MFLRPLQANRKNNLTPRKVHLRMVDFLYLSTSFKCLDIMLAEALGELI